MIDIDEIDLDTSDGRQDFRKELIRDLSDARSSRVDKLLHGRYRDVEKENQRTKDLKGIATSTRAILDVLDQMERSEIEERLDAIEQQESFEIPA